MKRLILLMILALLAGCDDGGGSTADDGGAGGGAGMDAGTNVPFEGDIPPLPAGTEIEDADHFPLVEGGVWRYRREANDPLATPGPVEQGGEATISSVTEIDGGQLEVVRRTVTIIDVFMDGASQKGRQTIDETFVVTPPERLVGPKVEYKALKIEERVVDTQAFVRVLERTYLPPYVFIEDAWKVGLVQTNIQVNDIRLTQTVLQAGEEEPTETSGLVTIKVDVDPVGEGNGEILAMEGKYREGIRKISVFDDFSSTLQRNYWVEPGLGVVKWQFAASNNIPFTLTESNLEVAE